MLILRCKLTCTFGFVLLASAVSYPISNFSEYMTGGVGGAALQWAKPLVLLSPLTVFSTVWLLEIFKSIRNAGSALSIAMGWRTFRHRLMWYFEVFVNICLFRSIGLCSLEMICCEHFHGDHGVTSGCSRWLTLSAWARSKSKLCRRFTRCLREWWRSWASAGNEA